MRVKAGTAASGLIEPVDLDRWQHWQRRRQMVRRAARSLVRTPSVATPLELVVGGSSPRLLLALEATHASVAAALLAPLAHLELSELAVIGPAGCADALPAHAWAVEPYSPEPVSIGLASINVAFAASHAGAIGGAAHELAIARDIPFFVSQHGALTPYAPPLPPNATLLAWSEADAQFWKSGRTDVQHHVVGSQLLWEASVGFEARAARTSTNEGGVAEPLTYLGQMHAAELPRGQLVRAAAAFCRQHDATYRPHPSEKDKLSRLAHAAYRRAGIAVDGSRPLNELTGPVVSVFSTGVLEAAAQGRDAWVDFPRPPAWLEEFWERYGMHRHGDSPTPAPPRPEVEPARRIAEILTEAAR